MEQRFSNNSLDLEKLREFCEREGDFFRISQGPIFVTFRNFVARNGSRRRLQHENECPERDISAKNIGLIHLSMHKVDQNQDVL